MMTASAQEPKEGPDIAVPGQSPGQDLDASHPGDVVFSVGGGYFHDGSVGQGLYEKDLPPGLVAAVEGAQLLLRSALSQFGVEGADVLVLTSGGWELRLGPGQGQAQLKRLRQKAPVAGWGQGRPGWLEAVSAARQTDHAEALASFEAEATQALGAGRPQAAAVAFRAAAASARSVGRRDKANKLLRLAGKSYLQVAEAATTPPEGVFRAYREAAKMFLEAGNLPLAQQCLGKALSVGRALGLIAAA